MVEVVRKRSGQLEHEGPTLGRIHSQANYRKAFGYWLGFLKGVMASEGVERAEMAPLKRIRNSNFITCYAACETEDQCRAFAYVRKKSECWLKDRVGYVSKKSGVDLGIK